MHNRKRSVLVFGFAIFCLLNSWAAISNSQEYLSNEMDASFVLRVKKIIKNVLKIEGEISNDTSLNLDVGSLEVLYAALCMEFEDEFEIEIPDEECKKFKTVRDVLNYLKIHA